MNTTEIRAKLLALVNQGVTVENSAYGIGSPGKFAFNLHGTLETPIDDDPNFLLRVKECYEGSSTISFNERHVDNY